MHTRLGALSYAAEFVERVDTSSVPEEKASSGGTASSDDDVELTVRGDNASSDNDTIELSPQVTVRDSVVGYTEPSAIATSSYYRDLSVTVSGPSMSVTSRWVEQQRERSLIQRFRQQAYRLSVMIELSRILACVVMRR